MFGYKCALVYFLTLYIILSETRSINKIENIESIVDDLSYEQNEELYVKLAKYRHRFEHSLNIKKIRWTNRHEYNKAYCEFCDLVVPVVRKHSFSIQTKFPHYFFRFDYLLKQIKLLI